MSIEPCRGVTGVNQGSHNTLVNIVRYGRLNYNTRYDKPFSTRSIGYQKVDVFKGTSFDTFCTCSATEFMNGLETTYATEPMDIPNVKQCQKNHGVPITAFVGKLDTSSPMEVKESTEPVPMSTENN